MEYNQTYLIVQKGIVGRKVPSTERNMYIGPAKERWIIDKNWYKKLGIKISKREDIDNLHINEYCLQRDKSGTPVIAHRYLIAKNDDNFAECIARPQGHLFLNSEVKNFLEQILTEAEQSSQQEGR